MSCISLNVNEQIAVIFIQDGKTALFYSTWTSDCKDDEVKDVLRYLVIEKGIDINSVDKVAFLLSRFRFGNSIFSSEGLPYCTHVIIILHMVALLTSLLLGWTYAIF